jgi:glycosyl transferase family 25
MNCFIINLPQDIERREFLVKDMEKFNLNFSIIEAVDGRTIPAAEIGKYYNNDKSIELFNREMTPGEIGCALSHNKIYKKIVSESIPSAVILEDDICIVDSEIGDLLSDLEKIYPAEIPVIVLLNFVERYVSNKDDIIINEKYTLHDSYRSISAASYFITKSAAEILSKNLFPVYVVADKWEYYQEKFFPVKMIIPNCIDLSEKSLQSSICSRGDRRTKIKKKINLKYYFRKHLKKIIFSIFKKPFIKTKRQKRI